jgi:Inositol hexakisphosphate
MRRLASAFVTAMAVLGVWASLGSQGGGASQGGALPIYVVDTYWRDIRGCSQFEPVHWRTATGCLRLMDDEGLEPDVRGLDTLRISGSADPTLANLKWMAGLYGKDTVLTDVDLRQEAHVYVDGLPISQFQGKNQINWGKTDEAILSAEREWAATLARQGRVTVSKLGAPKQGLKVGVDPEEIAVKRVQTEEEAAKEAGVGYLRICVPDMHPPAPWHVDQFLNFLKRLPAGAWLHFHCAAGDGRTTTFMVMRDILENGKQVSLEDITTRQARLGGIDLLERPSGAGTQPWKVRFADARVSFIRGFYDYVRSGAYPAQSYSGWLKQQPASDYNAILKTEAYGPAPAS